MKDTRSQRYDVGEPDPEYVSLEDLTTLAMNKIEALSVEGLRIQSGMSDKDAPSNISPQSIGEISALEVALAAALDIRPLDKRNKVAIRGYYKRWSSCRCISSIKKGCRHTFADTFLPVTHSESDINIGTSIGRHSGDNRRYLKQGLDWFRGTYTTIDLFCAAINLQAGFTLGVVHAFMYFPPTPGPAQHVSSDGSPFSSPGLSSSDQLRDLKEMQNLLTEFYLAFLESIGCYNLSLASLCSTQKLIESDGSSNVCLPTAQPYVVGGLHELSSSCDNKNTQLLLSLCVSQRTTTLRLIERVSNAQRDLSDSGKRKVKAYIGSAAFQACSVLCH
ncbi:plastid movement impaired 1-related 1 protein [Tanacetum coccineum]|uniref:Plastid movement impaired 1-related 1 protein n=1 Tax=Tanacetum coccineum TaxID=301880 RepID=A0ABQ4XRS1_9ASTR